MTGPLPRLKVLCAAGAMILSSPASAMPDFVPSPGGIFGEFTALTEPRTEVPVGALWVQDYGPTGDGAGADNLITVKSLAGVTINRETQLSLFSGILNLFGFEPSYRSKVSVRLADVTIVRVKDPSKLTGPTEEPRLYEALRAGTITISTDNDLGLDLDTRAAGQSLPVVGRADTGRRRSFSIDGRDMFIAYRVATLKGSQDDGVELAVRRGRPSAEASLGEYRIRVAILSIGNPPADTSNSCLLADTIEVTLNKKSSGLDKQTAPQAATHRFVDGTPLRIPLPVPQADGRGGLYTAISLKSVARKADAGNPVPVENCSSDESRQAKFIASLEGTRLQTLSSPRAPSW